MGKKIKENMNTSDNNIIWNILILILMILLEIWFYRRSLDGNLLFGDAGDGRFNNLMCEYWFDLFCGKGKFGDLRCFWPEKGTLGYSDMMLGVGLLHSLFRVIGCDVFLAHKLSLLIIHFFGVIFTYLLLRELKCDRIVCLIGIAVSFWSCSVAQLMVHTQNIYISIIPMVVLMILKYYNNRNEPVQKRIIFGIGTVLSIGMAFLTAFYVAYFMMLFLGLTVIFYLFRERSWKPLCSYIYIHLKEWLFYFVLNMVWMIPFLRVYLPVFVGGGGFSADSVMSMSPRWFDLFRNISQFSIEKNIVDVMPWDDTMVIHEVSYGLTLIVMCLFIGSVVILFKSKAADKKTYCMARSLTLAVIVLLLSVVKWEGFSLWIIIRSIIPGASALRAVGRVVGILTVPIGIIIAMALHLVVNLWDRKYYQKVMALLLLLAMIIVVNISQCPCTFWKRDDMNRYLENIKEPPENCEAMFIYSVENSIKSNVLFQLDAWMIADYFDINTINGYSGHFPEKWGLLDKEMGNYIVVVLEWLRKNNVSRDNIYGYDTSRNTWDKIDMIKKQMNIYLPEDDEIYVEGFEGNEGDFRWMGGTRSILAIPVEHLQGDVEVNIDAGILGESQRMMVRSQDQILYEEEVVSSTKIQFTIPKEMIKNDQVILEIYHPDAISPYELYGSEDKRELSFSVKNIILKEYKEELENE